jgi:hypothetical protein
LSPRKCDADHVRRAAFLIFSDHEMHVFGRRRKGYDSEFRRHKRPALRNSRHALCDVVDIRSGVRREPCGDLAGSHFAIPFRFERPKPGFKCSRISTF